MLTTMEHSKYCSVVVCCLIMVNQGNVLSFSAWQNKMKDTFNLTQTQVEVIGSLQNIGYNAGFTSALILENYGIKLSSLFGLATGSIGYLVNSILISSSIDIRGNVYLRLLIYLLFTLIGVGVGTSYILSYTVGLKNVTTKNGGKFIAVVGSSCYAIISLTSWIASNSISLANLMWIFIVLHIIACTLGMIFLKELHETSDIECVEDKTDSNDNKDGINDLERKTKPVNSETTDLIRDQSSTNGAVFGDLQGLEIMKCSEFWLYLTCIMISVGIDFTIILNIGVYLRSLGYENHLTLVTTTAPILAIASKITIGLVSDACLKKIPRLIYLIIIVIVKFLALTSFIFFGDYFGVILLLIYVCYFSYALNYLIGPILLGDYFGMKYLARNFGSVFFGSSLLAFILHTVLGLLYDRHALYSQNSFTCKGLDCFHISTIILMILTIINRVTSVILYKRTILKDKI